MLYRTVAGSLAVALICGFAAIFGAAAPAGAATDAFALSSAAVPNQSSVTWQGPPVNPPSTPNPFPDAASPITLTGQIDPSTGAITDGALTLPAIPIIGDGQHTLFAFSEVHPGTATGNFNSSTDAVTLNDTLTLTFSVPAIPIVCVSTPINVAFSGTWDATTQDVTLAASGFTIPNFVPGDSNCSLASGSLNASPGGTAGAVGNAMSIALNGQFAPGLPTTTTLAASPPSPQLAGTAVTLTATVTDPSSTGTPTGTVTFDDNGASIGTGTLSGSGSSPTATLTTTTLPSGANQQLTVAYSGDANYAPSASAAQSYTVTPLPTVGATLPTSMTVPSASAQPTVSAVSPTAGPAAGGTKVTITGTGFTPTASASFGSTPATGVTYVGPTELTATAPAGTGVVNVTVTTSAGTSATSSLDLFAYGAPTVTAIGPSSSPAGVGVDVIIAGAGFTPDATVNFGSTPAAAVQFNSATSITALSPKSGSAGSTVDVTVTTPGGTSATSAADRYTYSASTTPAVASLSAYGGPAAGGTSVTITGTNFTGATAVNFGSTPATTFTVSSATSIKATSPAGTSGTTVDVTVTTPNGTSAKWLQDQFTYGPPTVTGVSPSGGPAVYGTVVTVTGTGFTPSGDTVKFGTASSNSVTVNSPTSLTVTAPAGTDTVNVAVTTGGGTSATSPADEFTYAPTVTGVSPPSGPTAGGTAVTITGTGFTGATAVNFGTTAATGVTVVSPTEITATSPAGTAGNADVTVTTPIGTSATSTADQFFYGAPTVTAVSPDAGPTTGGTTVTVSGTGFTGASAVKFGSTAAASYTVVSPTQLTAVSPGGTAGSANITVTTNGGTFSAAAFTYNSAPSVTSLTPDTGSPNGGTGVTITGVNFTDAAGVNFGSTPATAFTVVSATSITATSPAGTGAVDVTVSSAAGTSATGPGDVFAYGTPTVTNVTPSGGVTSGGTSVVITGTGFVGGTTVKFGSVAATSVTITSPTSITAVSPEQAAGAVDVTVTNAAGTSATSPSDVFTYSAGGLPGQASLTFTNPSTGQSWSQLYAEITLSLNGGTDGAASTQPASNLTLSYQDTSGGWCPLTLTASGTGSRTKPYILTAYFSGVGSSCGSAPGSFSLAPGASLTIPIQLTYASATYVGAQVATASLYSGTCASATSCTQSGALNGAATGSSTVELSPPAPLASTVLDGASTKATTPVRQGFLVQLKGEVGPAVTNASAPVPTGTDEFLVDGNPAAITSDGVTPTANPVPLSVQSAPHGFTLVAYYSTAGLSPGTHTLTSVYSGDAVYAPSTLTETITVLPAPAGTPFACTGTGSLITPTLTTTGYVTATSSTSAPTPSGSSATVNNASVTLDTDPNIQAEVVGNNPVPFTLSPDGTAVSTSNPPSSRHHLT